MLDHPFDREFGIEAACFGQGCFRLVHPARLRVGGGQVCIDLVTVKTQVDRLAQLGDHRVSMAKAKFCLSRQ
jgi:hypothetical protein